MAIATLILQATALVFWVGYAIRLGHKIAKLEWQAKQQAAHAEDRGVK